MPATPAPSPAGRPAPEAPTVSLRKPTDPPGAPAPASPPVSPVPSEPGPGPGAAEPAPEPGLRLTPLERMKLGFGRSAQTAQGWITAADLDGERAEATVRARRRRQADTARCEHTAELRELRAGRRAAHREGDADRAAALAAAVEELTRMGPDIETPPEAEVSAPEVSRLRVKQRITRAGITAAGAYGGLHVIASMPGLLIVAIPAAIAAVWHAGRVREPADSGDKEADRPVAEVTDAGLPQQPQPVELDRRRVADPTPPPPDQAVWMEDALRENGITFGRILQVATAPWGVMVDIEMPGRGARQLAERLTDVNSSLRRRAGATSFRINTADTGIVTIRVVDSDPFQGLGAPPPAAPLSRSVTDPLPVGLELDGRPYVLELLRVHGALIGGSGSGKSSALWTIIDALSACRDVVVMGIDLSGAPALNAWGDVIQHLATEPEDAEALLKRLVQWGRGRCSILGTRSRPRLGQPMPDLTSENWAPSPEAPQIVLVIDEYPTVVEAGLWAYVATLLKVTRKAAITLLLASQRATKDEMGSTTVKAQLGLRALLACDAEDVKQLLGPGMRAQGWTPDVLQPALGEQPYDAGVVYAYGGRHVIPDPKKFYRLSLAEVHRRALERMAAGLPAVDPTTAAFADDGQEVRVDLDALEADTDGDPLTTGQRQLLEAVIDLMDGHPRAHCRTLVSSLAVRDPGRWGEWTATDLGAALRETGIEVKAVKVDGRVTAGAHLDAVVRRLTAAPQPPAETPAGAAT